MPALTPEQIDRLKAATKQFEKDFDDLRMGLTGIRLTRYRTAEKSLKELLKILQPLVEDGGGTGQADRTKEDEPSGDRKTIAMFFEQVGEGVVQAQKKLDAKSREYMAEAKGFPPTMFRLPKANAEIRFGIEHAKKTGFDIFIAEREDTTRESMQHRVSFDVVSAPPPPDVLAAMTAMSVPLPFVTYKVERDAIRGRLLDFAKNPEKDSETRKQAESLAEVDNFARAFVLRLDDAWAFLLPDREDKKLTLEVAYLNLDGEKFERRPVKFQAGMNRVLNLLASLAEEQAKATAASEEKS